MKGDKDEARKWFAKAVAGTREKAPTNKELLQFWAEAAEMLGKLGPTQPAAPALAIPDNPFVP